MPTFTLKLTVRASNNARNVALSMLLTPIFANVVFDLDAYRQKLAAEKRQREHLAELEQKAQALEQEIAASDAQEKANRKATSDNSVTEKVTGIFRRLGGKK